MLAPSTLPISTDQALAFRLARQRLLEPAPDLLTAAATLLGAQAQVQSAAVLQLKARARGATDAAVRDALYETRALVRLWGQRSTLHLWPTADLPLLMALRRRAVPAYLSWVTSEGVSEEQALALAQAIADALAQAPHSRDELADRIAPVLGEWARPWLTHSWGGAIKLAAAMGLVCHGPERPRAATFVRLDRWAGPVPVLDDALAMATLADRYLAAYGPAGPADFAKFAGIRVGAARDAFAALGDRLVPVDMDGRAAFLRAADEADLRRADAAGHLTVLPLFDPYLLAHADTSAFVPPKRRPQVYRTAGWISAVVLREGRAVAAWSHQRRGDGYAVELTPFARLGARERKRIGRALEELLGGEVALADAGA